MDPRRVADASGDIAIVTDEKHRVLYCNKAAREILRDDRAVVGRSLHEFLRPRDVFGNPLAPGIYAFDEMVRNGRAIRDFELDIRTRRERSLRVSVSVMVFASTGASGYRLVFLAAPLKRRRRADVVIERLLQEFSPAGGKGLREGAENGRKSLTPRQGEVLSLLAQGKTSREISEALGISVNTVRNHTQSAIRRLGARSKTEAVSKALRSRLI